MNRHLEHRTNNAYDTILLIEDGQVIGEWETDRNDKPFSDFQSSGDLGDWDATWPGATDPNAYGDLVIARKDQPMNETLDDLLASILLIAALREQQWGGNQHPVARAVIDRINDAHESGEAMSPDFVY